MGKAGSKVVSERKTTAKKAGAVGKRSGQKAAKKPSVRATASTALPEDDEVRTLARRIVYLTTSGNDESAMLALYDDNVESIEANNPPARGIDAIRQKFRIWRGMVQEQHWQAKNVVVENNMIVIEWEGDVTLTGGRRVHMREVAVHEVKNGKIICERYYYDPSVFTPA